VSAFAVAFSRAIFFLCWFYAVLWFEMPFMSLSEISNPLPSLLAVSLWAESSWCERGDLNPHGFTRQILSLVRLPIPPLSHLTFSATYLDYSSSPFCRSPNSPPLVRTKHPTKPVDLRLLDCAAEFDGRSASSIELYCAR
jgi:hypothetical protein